MLLVTDTGDKPAMPNYSELYGVLEDVQFVQCRVTDLPDNVIGYEAVDQIVWMNANAGLLEAAP